MRLQDIKPGMLVYDRRSPRFCRPLGVVEEVGYLYVFVCFGACTTPNSYDPDDLIDAEQS